MEYKNFPFKHNGKTYWYSRSMATVGYVFAKNENSEWCVLANKRGTSCPTNIGRWNVPCGYIEHGITGADNCVKEIKEETGIILESKDMTFLWLDTVPDNGKQNINLAFYCILDKITTSYQLSKEFSEPDEVDEIEWIPISEIDSYDFAFNQKSKIYTIYYKYLKISWFRKMMLKLTRKLMKKFIFGPVK